MKIEFWSAPIAAARAAWKSELCIYSSVLPSVKIYTHEKLLLGSEHVQEIKESFKNLF